MVEIESTIEKIDESRWVGSHEHDGRTVLSTYYSDEESMMLLHKIISLAENEVVDLYEESLPMREEPYGMVVDGFKTIEEFARENHYADPEQDFEDVWP